MILLEEQDAYEALAALDVRARWYETRGYAVPAPMANALARLARKLGLDPATLEPAKSDPAASLAPCSTPTSK